MERWYCNMQALSLLHDAYGIIKMKILEMGSANKTPYFFKSKPLFGLDIGKGSLKVVQLAPVEAIKTNTKSLSKAKTAIVKPKLVGYGSINFDANAIADGVVAQPELIAEAAQQLFKAQLVGDITSRRVAITIPSYRTFTRSIQLPLLSPRELADAVRLEAEQYIPVSLDEMYLDYTSIARTQDSQEVLAIAVPKNIVDSYLDLSALMGLEPVLIETTMSAAGRLFSYDRQSDVPALIIDFGSLSSDISIYDHGIVTTGTVDVGGQVMTELIRDRLSVSDAEAKIIKVKYGLGVSKRQTEIQAALDSKLQKIIKEIKRLIRYYGERYGTDRPIGQIIMLGGGANMPGLSDLFTSSLRLPVRAYDPWNHIDSGRFQLPAVADRPMYATAIGLGLVPHGEVFT